MLDHCSTNWQTDSSLNSLCILFTLSLTVTVIVRNTVGQPVRVYSVRFNRRKCCVMSSSFTACLYITVCYIFIFHCRFYAQISFTLLFLLNEKLYSEGVRRLQNARGCHCLALSYSDAINEFLFILTSQTWLCLCFHCVPIQVTLLLLIIIISSRSIVIITAANPDWSLKKMWNKSNKICKLSF